MDISSLLPADISLFVAASLIGVSFLGSLMTAMLGLGGGLLMLSALTLIFPPFVVVPVHGAIQLGSNASRSFFNRLFIQWPLVLWIALGTIVGSLLGGKFAVGLPENIFRLAIGFFILFMVWVPRPNVRTSGALVSFTGGVIFSFLGMIVGITGPLVLSFLGNLESRRSLVATHAAVMTCLNSAKVGAFILFGFAFAPYMPLIFVMVISGFLGTFAGTKVLIKMPEIVFRYGFKIVISLMAFELIRRGISQS